MFNSRVKITFLLMLLGRLLSACGQLKEAGRTGGHISRDARFSACRLPPYIEIDLGGQIYDRTEAH
jgi:hypothetical protein